MKIYEPALEQADHLRAQCHGGDSPPVPGVDLARGTLTAIVSISSRYCTHDPYGGPGASGWDLDWDGYPGWWQPGVYDHDAYPAEGWDCDDNDAGVYPGNGC